MVEGRYVCPNSLNVTVIYSTSNTKINNNIVCTGLVMLDHNVTRVVYYYTVPCGLPYFILCFLVHVAHSVGCLCHARFDL